MKNSEKKAVAQSLYLKGILTQKAIAMQVGISEPTIRRWVKDGRWQKLREGFKVSPRELRQNAYQQIAAIDAEVEGQGGVPNKTQSDAKGVLLKQLAMIKERTLEDHLDTMGRYIDYLKKTNANTLKGMLLDLGGFAEYLGDEGKG